MATAIMIDFGSTYTKTVAVDLTSSRILGCAQAPTTVQDLMIGLTEALANLAQITGPIEFDHKLACSSAAGGLRMIAIGFVKELTVEASRRAALGAGAKVVEVFANGLDSQDLALIKDIAPDLILLSGGTDGGNKAVLLENARMLAGSGVKAPVVVAGNRKVAHEAAEILKASGVEAIVTENVLPQVDVINVEPAREAIREVFMKRIVLAKGLDKAQSYVGHVLMPTPMAVLHAAKLLAEGTRDEPGLGDVVIVDVGGATTDLHSVGETAPSGNTVIKGLPEPFAKRTVEGDLGIRHNARTLLELAGPSKIFAAANLGSVAADLPAYVEQVAQMPRKVPDNPVEARLDLGLAKTATEVAMARHAGTFEEVHFVDGKVRQLTGKDLSGVKALIGTGGVFAHGAHGFEILEGAKYDPAAPQSLRPREPQLYLDSSYCLYAVGLLSQVDADAALRVAKNTLRGA
jgi:uncharacterized protein (TIGR01319 family)